MQLIDGNATARQIKAKLALETLVLKENAAGLVRFEESQIRTDKDGVTRTALLIFTVLIKLK